MATYSSGCAAVASLNCEQDGGWPGPCVVRYALLAIAGHEHRAIVLGVGMRLCVYGNWRGGPSSRGLDMFIAVAPACAH